MKARFAALLLAALALLSLAGCGVTVGGSAAPTADMEALQQALLAADPSLPEMLSVTSNVDDAKRLFTYLSDFDYEKVEGYLLSYSASGTADEIAVIAVKDPADLQDAYHSLADHKADRLKLFQTYGPEEAARIENAPVTTDGGKYAILMICDDPDSVLNAFETYINSLTKEG